MELEQQNNIYEVLQWGRYIHPTISHYIQAINNHRHYYRPIVLRGKYIDMDNDQLWDLILRIVSPTSSEEWVQSFNILTKFTQLPQGYVFDITKYDFMYTAILEYLYLLQRVIRFLDWNAEEKLSPPMKTRDGKIGYMELVWRKIPSNIGERLHLGLSAQQVSECRDISEYLSLFGNQSQNLHDDSTKAKKNRMRFQGNSSLTSDAEINTKSYAATGKSPVDPKLHYMNSLTDKSLMLFNNPYIPVEKSELPNSSHDFLKPIHSNRYDVSTDEDILDYDYCDVNVDDLPLKSVINPMYNTSDDNIGDLQSLGYGSDQVGSNQTNLHALDINRMRTLPCFNALLGNCKNGTSCHFSHERSVLQAAYDHRMKELTSSPFARTANPSLSSNFRHNVSKDQRRPTNLPSSPFGSKQPEKPLRQMYAEDPIPPPELSTQVTILGRNVV
jgi:hypothetical protein